MTEDEWVLSPPGDAVDTFLVFMWRVVKMAYSGVLSSSVTNGLNATVTQKLETHIEAQLAQQPESAAHVNRVRTLFSSGSDESLRNGLIIIASISAFESCLEDFCKGVLTLDPTVIDDKHTDLIKAKYTLRQFLSASDEDRRDVIYQSIENNVGKSSGVGRYEHILGYLDLSEEVPSPIKDAIYKAQVVRHVWAHRAGIADKEFVDKASHLGFNEGDEVAIALTDLSEYLNALLLYVMIVSNRHRALFGLGPLPFRGDQAPNSAVVNAYSAMYSPSASSES